MPDSKPYRDKVLLVLGDIEQARGSYPEAIVYFRRLVDEHPESRDVVDARLRLGACYYSRQLFDKSAEEYLLVVKAGHTDKLPQEVIVWALNWFSENKRTADAIQLGEAVLKLKGLDPGLAAECMFLVGETLERAARYPEASSRYRELLKEHPTSARRFSARVGLARCLRRTGEHAGAEKLLNELIGETTGVVKSLATIELASLQLELKRLDDALRNYLFVAILEPREDLAEEALYRSAVICSQLGRADDASRYASEFVSRFPGSKHRAEVELLIKAGR